MGARQEEGRSEGDGGKTEWKLSEDNTRAVSRGQNELTGKFKTVWGDFIGIRRYVIDYMHIPKKFG